MITQCSFAWPGTYGHECSQPAIKVAVFQAKKTRNGLFFTGRCEKCAAIKGGENSGLIRFEALASQANEWL